MSKASVKRVWKVPQEDRSRTGALAKALGVPRIVAHLLLQRGVESPDAAQIFLDPIGQRLSDPMSLTDMARAVARLEAARERGERVLVFGDYDVDGLSATAILFRGLQRFGIIDVDHTVPHRVVDGYGIHPEHVRLARENGVNLIVTVDNGISAFEAIDAANACGIDVIVTDHHKIDGRIPDAYAVVNPQREEPNHPAMHASGALVAFKLVQALEGRVPEEDLDLAALGVVADVMPLHGENRAVVAQGLAQMRRGLRCGLVHLARLARVDLDSVTAENIAFGLAPRINACGRLGDGQAALRLLLTDCEDEASFLANELHDINEERRTIEREILEEALACVERDLPADCRGIVLARRGWHQGVIGIVAARLMQRFGKPVVLIGIDDDGTGRGSARGPGDVDLAAAFSACQELLVQCGGHRAAAGLTVREENVPAFTEAFDRVLRGCMDGEEPVQCVEIDGHVGLSEVDASLLQTMARLEPFGHANPQPVLCAYGVNVVPNSIRELRGGHLRFLVKQGARSFAAIGFSMADRGVDDLRWDAVDIAFTPQFNTWRGETSIQLVLKDFRASVAEAEAGAG